MSIIKSFKNQSPFLKLFYIFLIQLALVLLSDWLLVKLNMPPPDILIWGILLPAGLFFSAIIFYRSSPFDGWKRWLAVPMQLILHTIATWGLIFMILIYFHRWIGGMM